MWFDHVTTVPPLQMATGASSSAVGVMTNEQLTAAVLDLGKMVAEIHGFLLGPQPNPPLPSQQQLLPPLPAWIAGLSKPIYTPPLLDITGTAPSASAQDPPPVALSCAEGLDLVRCVGDLGHAICPTGSGHAIFPAGGGWGGAPLVVLHRKPSTLLCVV